jgi:hypothetical protein
LLRIGQRLILAFDPRFIIVRRKGSGIPALLIQLAQILGLIAIRHDALLVHGWIDCAFTLAIAPVPLREATPPILIVGR